MKNDKCRGFSLIELLVVLTLMALLALFLGSKLNNNMNTDDRFYETCHQMEEIKEAIVGRPGLYCNGIRQFTGYVSDMGALPGLFCIDRNGDMLKLDKKLDKDHDISQILKECTYPPQPKALWTRDMNGDGKDEIGNDALWEYHAMAKIWAGWRGPYIAPPQGGVLRDAWGNPFVFVIGELVSVADPDVPKKIRTFRCIRSHESSSTDPCTPGMAGLYWRELTSSNGTPVRINAEEWIQPEYKDSFYDDALVIVSYGKNGRSGGKRLDGDLVLTIYREEYTGEVCGHAGSGYGGDYVRQVTLYYPRYTEEGGRVVAETIHIVNNDVKSEYTDPRLSLESYWGINFHFGAAPSVAGDPPVIIFDPNSRKIDVLPIGIRSIKAGTKTLVFPLIAGDNQVGTVK